jgi:agmatine deiminase
LCKKRKNDTSLNDSGRGDNKKAPFELGYRMPAEWRKHEATWLSWPKDPLTFPEGIIERVELIYLEIIETIQGGERVELLVDDQQTEDKVRSLLSSLNNIHFQHIKTADVWIRDYGPIFVKSNGQVAATKWIFNAWGEKYDELLRDNASGEEISRKTGLHVFEPKMVLEGGSIDVNGIGSCLTTKQCLLNRNRNDGLSTTEIETKLHDYLGVDLIWLESGIAGDDTDGHVDDIARFVNETTVVCMAEHDDLDFENHAALQRNRELLEKAKTPDGSPLNVVSLDMPAKVVVDGERLPASYANFYVANEAVLIPVFGDVKNDEKALSTLSGLFPGRNVVGINCRELVYGFGGIHCITQQQPSAGP